MDSIKKTSRRNMLKAGLASVAGATIITGTANAAKLSDIPPKASGETRVIFLGGDNLHNFMAQEPALKKYL